MRQERDWNEDINSMGRFEQQNEQLRSARMKKSWTPKFVSEQVGVSLNTYIRWESGAQRPRLASLDALCRIFKMSPAELGFQQSLDARMAERVGMDAAVHRGLMEEQEQAATLPDPTNRALPVGPDEATLAEAVSESASTSSGISDDTLSLAVPHWSSDLASYWQMYMSGNQSTLEQLLPDYLVRLSKPALTPGPMQRDVARLMAQAYQLHALLLLQHSDFVAACNAGTQALVYAQLAKDWDLYVAGQIRLASIHTANKRIGAALGAYNDALRRVNSDNKYISPMLHSWIFAGLAEIQATMGREADSLQLLKLASAVFPAQPEHDACYAYTRCDRSMLYLYQGLVFLRLGQPRMAWEAFAQVDEMRPAPPERQRADFLRYRAYTSLVLGNMTQCCVYLEAAAGAAQAIASDLIFSEIYTLYEHMLAVWGQEPRVRALATLFQK